MRETYADVRAIRPGDMIRVKGKWADVISFASYGPGYLVFVVSEHAGHRGFSRRSIKRRVRILRDDDES